MFKCILATTTLALTATADIVEVMDVVDLQQGDHEHEMLDDPEWKEFKGKFRKSYQGWVDEVARYRLFQESKKRVAALNELNGQPAFGLTWMSDRFPTEKYKTGLVKPRHWKPTAAVAEFSNPRNPANVDWRLTDAVTSVKNQGQCGSCWAFSATEAIESQVVMQTGGQYRIELSPQQITSCSPASGQYGCQGCNGGFTEGAYEYVKSVVGLSNGYFIPYEQSLTETTETKACPAEKVESLDGEYKQLQGSYVAVSGYSYAVKPCTGECENQDLKKFAAALETTPVSVCVNAGTWNDYTGGVLTAKACGSMASYSQDHCVMAVGFNTTAPTPYWIVRNSWATTWGEQGYIYLEMAKNTCGVADDVTIPEITVDLTAEQHDRADELREAMYMRATGSMLGPIVI